MTRQGMRETTDLSTIFFRQHVVVFFCFFAFWFLLLAVSGSLFSGYHLADDHEVLRMGRDVANEGVWLQAKKWIDIDLSVAHRFKPVYYLHRVIEARLFGSNFLSWKVYTGCLAILASFLLYRFGRWLGWSLTEAILFPLLVFVGKQSVIWWSLGPQETIGMTMLAAALACMVQMITAKRNKGLWASLFIIFTVLMSLSKESFIVLLPAFMFWIVWLKRAKTAASWRNSLRSHICPVLILGLIFVFEIFFIVHYVGIGGYSAKAGGIDGFTPLAYLKTAVLVSLSVSAVGYGLIFVLGFLLIVFSQSGRTDQGISVLGEFGAPLTLFFLITGPQCVLYARSGFYGRYLLPLLFGFAVLLIYFLDYLRRYKSRYMLPLPPCGTPRGRMMSTCFLAAGFVFALGGVLLLRRDWSMNIFVLLGKPTEAFADLLKPALILFLAGGISIFLYVISHKKNVKPLPLYYVVLCLTIALLVLKTTNFIQLKDFTWEGRQLSAIRSLVQEHTLPQDAILVVRDPVYPENGYSLKVMLNMLSDRPRVFVFGDLGVFGVNGNHDLNRWYDSHFINGGFSELSDKKAIRFIIVQGGSTRLQQERVFLSQIRPYLDMQMFQREDVDPFVVYFARKT
jgi:hypothetical protein